MFRELSTCTVEWTLSPFLRLCIDAGRAASFAWVSSAVAYRNLGRIQMRYWRYLDVNCTHGRRETTFRELSTCTVIWTPSPFLRRCIDAGRAASFAWVSSAVAYRNSGRIQMRYWRYLDVNCTHGRRETMFRELSTRTVIWTPSPF
jgi:hypothetical protein